MIFFHNGIPNIYEGDPHMAEEVFEWIVDMKANSRIELITRAMLEIMVENTEYLAVFFCKSGVP